MPTNIYAPGACCAAVMDLLEPGSPGATTPGTDAARQLVKAYLVKQSNTHGC